MGVVFRARHLHSGEEAALKTVRLANPVLLSSIRREIQRLRRLSHPGVVRIRDDGVHHSLPWYTMDLFDCATWEQVTEQRNTPSVVPPASRSSSQLDETGVMDTELGSSDPSDPAQATISVADYRRPLDPHELPEVLGRTRRLCETLSYIHGEGVIHRDLKPANVFLPGVDRTVLVDFGLVIAYSGPDGREVMQVAPSLAGTVAYMAPEQLTGELVDARADLFALGCMLYETLTGRIPFPISFRERLQLAAHPLVPPSRFVPWLPPLLDDLLAKLLTPDRRERLGHAADVAELLTASQLVNLPPLDPATHKPRDYLYRASFAGRDELLDELMMRLAVVGSGHGQQVLIEGESGCGKTRLLTEFLRRAAVIGTFVAAGECPPQGVSAQGDAVLQAGPLSPLRPLLQAIADLCRAQGEQATQALLGSQLRVLASIEPALASVPGAELVPALQPLPMEAAKLRLLAAMTETLVALGQRGPVLLLLDDLQWGDELTMQWLQHLSGETLASAPILICGSYRAEETTPALQQLATRPGVTRLPMGRLDEQAVGSLIADMLAVQTAPLELVQFVAEHAAGNPFFVTEYLHTAVGEGLLRRNRRGVWGLHEETTGSGSESWLVRLQRLGLPRTLRAMVERRLRSLDAELSKVLLAAAVLGREFDAELLRSVCGLSEPALADAMNDLLRQQCFEPAGGGRYRFGHDKLREAAYDSIPHDRLQQLHQAAALAMEARGAQSSELLSLAGHFAKAQVPGKARKYLFLAAQQLLKAGAHHQAAPLLSQAIAFASAESDTVPTSERAELHRLYADALFGLGETHKSAQQAEQALALCGLQVPTTAGGILWSFLRQLGEQVYRMSTTSRPLRPESTTPHTLAAALAALRLSTCYFTDSRPQLHVLWVTLLAANLADRAGPLGPRAVPYGTLGCTVGFLHMDKVAQRYFERARADATARGDLSSQAETAILECALYQGTGQWSALVHRQEEAVAISRACGNLLSEEALNLVRGGGDLLTGDLPHAATLLEGIRRSARLRGAELNLGWATVLLSVQTLWRGQPAAARELALGALPRFASDRGNAGANALAVSAAAAWQLGDFQRAHAEAEQALDVLERGPVLFQMWPTCDLVPDTLLLLWQAARERGLPSEAALQKLIRRALTQTRSLAFIAPIGKPLHLRALGVLARLEGRPARAQKELQQALHRAEQLAMPIAAAAAGVELAQLAPPGSAQRVALATQAKQRALAVGCLHWAERASALLP